MLWKDVYSKTPDYDGALLGYGALSAMDISYQT